MGIICKLFCHPGGAGPEGKGWAGEEGHSRRRPHEDLLFSSSCLSQLEQSEAKCEDALKTQKALTADLENMHSELENMTRSKSLVPVPSWNCGAPGQHRARGTSAGPLCAQRCKRDQGYLLGTSWVNTLRAQTSSYELSIRKV